MTDNSLGRNIEFPIYNSDGTSFYGLTLKKATVDSVVMSLSDKITGDAYYKDNKLTVAGSEYIEYRGVHYTLVNPPTIVKEGLVSDNSDLKGMTKYSFEFYHPMYQLSNLPFSDVAVTNKENKYLSQNKSFSWIGKPDDFIAKLNKNLKGTVWVVIKSDRFPAEKNEELSEVLQFDNQTIADALKKGYDTWGVPYVIDSIQAGEYYDENNVDYYSAQGGSKRFVILFGLPSNEIYDENDDVFVFQYGKGLGLKNNSRTPRNNKIVTRIAGYGSENNIPYGYPQIPWYGDSRWDYTAYVGTVRYDENDKVTNQPATYAYPIYKGIVGGQYIKLIKHPFTRTYLMPSIYSQTVFNKVSPYLNDGSVNRSYNPQATIIDYYDAVATQEYPYVNEINLQAPSYESHQFEDIKPELDSQRQLGIVSAVPLNKDLTPASGWDDTMDENGEYIQSYFQLTLPQLDFDVYACASITEEMQVNMRSGDCIGCTFDVQVDWDDYKLNFYDSDGNFVPDGEQRDLTKYPKSNLGQISIICQKDNNTFGTILPSIYQNPQAGDLFVFLGISLPLSYISNAETRLDAAMKSYMLENNLYYYDYPLKFDEYFLATHTDILSQIRPNAIIRFTFGNNEELQLFVKQLTVKYGENMLPQYDITLTDNVEVVLNKIGQVTEDVEKLGTLVATIREQYNRNIWAALDKRLSKEKNDSTPYRLSMGSAVIDDDTSIGGDTTIGGTVIAGGDASIGGNASITGTATIGGNTTVGTFAEPISPAVGSGAKIFGSGAIHAYGSESKFRSVYFGNYTPGLIAGAASGALIQESGDARFKSVSISDFLEVPEIRFNRATVYIGIGIRSVGGGVIEEVIQSTMFTGRCSLKLEDGEYGAVDLDDYCLGFWHNETVNPTTGERTAVGNAAADFDPRNGDYELAGFKSVYFKITAFYANESDFRSGQNPITDTTTPRGQNKYFAYTIRGNDYGSVDSNATRKTWANHPYAQMHFGQIANPTLSARQSLVITTTEYELKLMDMTSWNYSSANIRGIDGKLDGFSMYSKQFSGNGIVLGNAYIYGKIDTFEKIAASLDLHIDDDTFFTLGDTKTLSCVARDGYGTDITSQFVRWEIIRDSGQSAADATWNSGTKATAFQAQSSTKSIDLTYTASTNDIGFSDSVERSNFAIKAYIDNSNYISASIDVHETPADGADGADGQDAVTFYLTQSQVSIEADPEGKPTTSGTVTAAQAVMKVGDAAASSVSLYAINDVLLEDLTYTESGDVGYYYLTKNNIRLYVAIIDNDWTTIMYRTWSTRVVAPTDFKLTYQCLVNNAWVRRDATFSVLVSKHGATGATGALVRPCGEWVSGTTYYNNADFVDVVCVRDSNGVPYYYKLKDSVSELVSTTSPATDTTNWEEANNVGFVASSALIAGTGYIDVLGTGSLFVGQQGRTVDALNGWMMTSGSIKHRGTNLELTADGFLNDPDGLHLKVGGTSSVGTNLLYNAYFNELLCSVVGSSSVGYNCGAWLSRGGAFGGKYLAIGGESSGGTGSITSDFMGAGAIGKGMYAIGGTFTFSIYGRLVLGTAATVTIYRSNSEDMSSPTPVGSVSYSSVGTHFERKSVSFTVSTPRYYAFQIVLDLANGQSGEFFVDAVKLEYGSSPTQMSDSTNKNQLLPTGIDIENRTITLTTDNLVCRNNSGDQTMWVDKNGNLGVAGNIFTGMAIINNDTDMAKYAVLLNADEGIEPDAEPPSENAYMKEYQNSSYSQDARYLLSGGSNRWVPDMFLLSDIIEFGTNVGGRIILLPFYVPYSIDTTEQTPMLNADVLRTQTTYKTGIKHLVTRTEMKYLVGRRFTFIGHGQDISFVLPHFTTQNQYTTVLDGYQAHSLHDAYGLVLEYVMHDVYVSNDQSQNPMWTGIYPQVVDTLYHVSEVRDSDWGTE